MRTSASGDSGVYRADKEGVYCTCERTTGLCEDGVHLQVVGLYMLRRRIVSDGSIIVTIQ